MVFSALYQCLEVIALTDKGFKQNNPVGTQIPASCQLTIRTDPTVNSIHDWIARNESLVSRTLSLYLSRFRGLHNFKSLAQLYERLGSYNFIHAFLIELEKDHLGNPRRARRNINMKYLEGRLAAIEGNKILPRLEIGSDVVPTVADPFTAAITLNCHPKLQKPLEEILSTQLELYFFMTEACHVLGRSMPILTKPDDYAVVLELLHRLIMSEFG